ncbi:hypothetical protein JL721_3708 [Aureococcus anophagefferens]|nr:hypothetical protein JL721_3708 [Aureococcus anophagefferens]
MHDAPVLALAPSLDGTALASGDRDGCLKLRRKASDAVVSGSADGTVRVWDPRSAETVSTFSPPKALAKLERRAVADKERAVVAVLQQPGSESKFFVVDKSPTAVLADLRTGVAVAAFSSRDEPAKPPSEAARSGSPAATAGGAEPPRATTRCLGEDKVLYCFHVQSAALDRCCPIDDAKDVVGLAVHPHRNVVASFGDGDKLLLWKS